MKSIRQAWRMTLRDWRAGELRLLLAALLVAVAAVTSVGFFVDRIRLGLDRDAAQLLGGDLVVVGDLELPAQYRTEAERLGLSVAQTITFPSMAIREPQPGESGDPRSQLAGIKAVSPEYPLRGALKIAERSGGPEQSAQGIPPRGEAWVDEQLVSVLGVRVGEFLRLGDATLRVGRIITFEPDRTAGFINFAPRVLIRDDELPSTGLIQFGSRVTYRLMVAGERSSIRAYEAWLKPRLTRGQRAETLEAGRPEMQQAIERAKSFLALVALLTAMLAAVAIALAARRYSQRHIDACAVMRCLGSTQPFITRLFAIEFIVLALVGSVIGTLLGWVAHFGLIEWLGGVMRTPTLPAPSWRPALQGVVTGSLLLIGFAVPPLMQLRRVSPLRVLRRDLGHPTVPALATWGLGLIAFLALLLWFAGDLKLGLIAGGGFVVGFVVFAAVAYGVLRLSTPLRRRLAARSVVLRFALAGATRRPMSTVIQVVALSIGLMALLLLTLTRTDLIEGWRASAPADAPNRFVINIQPDQREAFNAFLINNGLPAQNLLPMVRGRLVGINERPVNLDDFDGRARRLVDREFNLSYMSDAPSHNRIVAGRWFKPDADEISVEEGLLKELGLKLGDSLAFDIAGQTVSAKISSVRKVEWNSFKVNFFVIFPPKLLEPLQQSLITSFRMPADRDIGPQLVAQFPNITLVDTGAILRQVQTVLDQVVAAVEFLFLFTLAAGVLVLYAALASTRDERVRESGLLRALGASRPQLTFAHVIEFALIGALAGLLASLGAIAIGQALARHAFAFEMPINGWSVLIGVAGGAAIALIGGWVGLRHVLNHPPLATLRESV